MILVKGPKVSKRACSNPTVVESFELEWFYSNTK